MTELSIIGVIATLVTLVVGVGTPIIKLNNTISRAITKIDAFEKSLDDMKQSNRINKDKVWEKLNEHTDEISVIKTDVEVLKSTM